MRDRPQRWGWMVGSEPSIDFLVGLLLDDGLRVEPFNLHPTRRGDLHRRGLTPGTWLDWLRRVVYMKLLGSPDSKIHPVLCWPGSKELKSFLSDRWDAYLADYPTIVSARRSIFPRPQDDDATFAQRFPTREAIGADQSHRLPTLRMYLVHYPAAVVCMPTPDVAALGDRCGEMKPDEFVQMIGAAAAEQRERHHRSEPK